MKILQVNNVYAEKSTGKLTKQLHEGLLAAGHEALVVYGRGKTFRGPGLIRLCPEWYGKVNGLLARLTGMPYGGCWISTTRLMGIILREKPDVVHLQCINGTFVNIYRLIRWLKKKRIKTVVSLHAEFMYTANCGHAFDCEQWKHGCRKCSSLKRATRSYFLDRTAASWRKMQAAFSGFEQDAIICPVSHWTQERGQQSDILKDFRFCTVFNGVDTKDFCYLEQKKSEDIVLNVTAFFSGEKNHLKGGWYLTELARRMPQVQFLVAGKAEPADELPKNLTLLGRISNQKELAELYRKAKLSIIVSKKETFSMPCAESLCCGTPVVGFEAGAPERISIPEYSEFIQYGDIQALEQLVCKWLAKSDLNYQEIARKAETVYSAGAMNENFMEVYRRVLWN